MLRTQYYRLDTPAGELLMRVTYEQSYPRKFEVKRRDDGSWRESAELYGAIMDGDADPITESEAEDLEASYGTNR